MTVVDIAPSKPWLWNNDKQVQAWHYLTSPDFAQVIELTFGGGGGGGKSALGTYWASRMCSAHSDVRYLIGRLELKNLRATTFKTNLEVLRKFTPLIDITNGPHKCDHEDPSRCGSHYWINFSSMEIRFCNGSEIVYKELKTKPSDPDFDDLGSLEITGAFIDEATEVSSKAINVVKSRIRYNLEAHGLTPKCLLTCNPGIGYTYQNYKDWRQGTLPPSKRFVQSLADDNPNLPESYIPLLMELDQATIQRIRWGNWEYGDTTGVFIPYETALDLYTNNHVLQDWELAGPRDQLGPNAQRWITADIAEEGADKFVVMIWEGFAVIKIYEYKKTRADEVLEILKDLASTWKVRRSRIIYDAGGVGSFLKGFLSQATPYLANAAPYKMQNQRLNFENLKSQLFWKAGKMAESGELYIADQDDPGIKDQLTEELSTFKNVNHGTDGKIKVQKKEILKQALGRSPDYAECFILRMLPEVKPRTRVRVIPS